MLYRNVTESLNSGKRKDCSEAEQHLSLAANPDTFVQVSEAEWRTSPMVSTTVIAWDRRRRWGRRAKWSAPSFEIVDSSFNIKIKLLNLHLPSKGHPFLKPIRSHSVPQIQSLWKKGMLILLYRKGYLSCKEAAHVLCTPYNLAPVYSVTSFQATYVHACLASYHLHFWQNDRDFLRATAVTRGWKEDSPAVGLFLLLFLRRGQF